MQRRIVASRRSYAFANTHAIAFTQPFADTCPVADAKTIADTNAVTHAYTVADSEAFTHAYALTYAHPVANTIRSPLGNADVGSEPIFERGGL